MRRAGAILVTSEELLSAQEAPQGASA